MRKLLASIYKEGTLLVRDLEGLSLLFVMPLILVVVMSLLQEKTFQRLNDIESIPIVVVNFDNDHIGARLVDGLEESGIYTITLLDNEDSILLDNVREQVAKGEYQMGVFIPQNTTEIIKARALSMAQQHLIGLNDDMKAQMDKQVNIDFFFDPVTKNSFRSQVKSSLKQFASSVETRIVLETYSTLIDTLMGQTTVPYFPKNSAIVFDEDIVSEFTGGTVPNSTQHNVPAWLLFGMFLICIPVAGNIIKERGEGCLARLKTMPVTYSEIMLGKLTAFMAVCLMQALLMMVIGYYVLPLAGLPQIHVNGSWIALIILTIACGFAATGYGIAVGSIATTQIQSSAFGAVSSVIFAAIGGAWIPVVIMSPVMQKVSAFSPINWGIHGYYEIFLRGSGTLEILPDVAKLLLFSAICLGISSLRKNYKRTM